MSQGSSLIFGFFALAAGRRLSVPKPAQSGSASTSSTSSTWYCFYSTTIQCSDGSALPAEIRIYSPRHDVPHPDNTVAFLVARAHLPPNGGLVLLDAIALHRIPGDPESDDYEDHLPDMPFPFICGLGTSMSKHQLLADGRSKGFPVQLSERVRDQQRTSTPFCIMGDSPRWINVPAPSPHSLVHFLGTASSRRDDGSLGVQLETLLYNPTPLPAPAPVPDPATPTGKRRKFNAFTTPASSLAIASSSGPSSSVPTPPASQLGLLLSSSSGPSSASSSMPTPPASQPGSSSSLSSSGSSSASSSSTAAPPTLSDTPSKPAPPVDGTDAESLGALTPLPDDDDTMQDDEPSEPVKVKPALSAKARAKRRAAAQ